MLLVCPIHNSYCGQCDAPSSPVCPMHSSYCGQCDAPSSPVCPIHNSYCGQCDAPSSPVCPMHNSYCGQCDAPSSPVCPMHSSCLWLVWCFPFVQYTALIVVSLFPVCPVHSSGCSQYVSCMPSAQLWLWSLCFLFCGQCDVPCMPSTWSVFPSYAQYTALTVVSMMLPVCPIHSSDCGQCRVPCMPNTQLWLWSVFTSYALYIALIVVSVP